MRIVFGVSEHWLGSVSAFGRAAGRARLRAPCASTRSDGPANTRWKLIDRSSDAANHDIAWQFRVGDRVKIRLVNEMDSDHPMHHPFHIHGAGRFLVLARDGEVEPNLVWSDTVLVRTGETVDILLEVTNPGRWMVASLSCCNFALAQVPGGDQFMPRSPPRREWLGRLAGIGCS